MEKRSIMDLAVTLTPELAQYKAEFVGLFPRGHVSLIAGEPGVGKTWFVLSMSKGIGDGSHGLGVEGEYQQGRVLLLSGETGVRLLADRLEQIGGMKERGNLQVLSSNILEQNKVPFQIDTALGRKNLSTAIKAFRPDIVVVDTLISFLSEGKDESSQSDMSDTMRGLGFIAQNNNIAIVVVHHFRKRSNNSTRNKRDIDEIIGSSAFIRLTSVIVGIERKNGNVRMVRCLKSWWKEFTPFIYKLENTHDGRVIIKDDYNFDEEGTPSIQPAVNKVKAFIEGLPFELEFSLPDVVVGSRVSRNTVATAMSAFLSKGLIEKIRKDGNMVVYKRMAK